MDDLRISATAHGLNYLPEYYAEASGGFERRGLGVKAWPCDPWTGVLRDLADGSADVALGGLWVPAMYAGKGRELVIVGQLNARFPMAVVTRHPVADFGWEWMQGKTVLAPGAGGSAPYEFTAGLMREAGADPRASRFVRDLSTDMLVELYTHGLGDALIADLVTATTLERAGIGALSCRLADVGGPMPNSVYYVRRDRLSELHDRLVPFLAAIRDAMAELTSGTADTAPVVASHWPDVAGDVLRDVTAELAANQTWTGIRIDPDACQRWTSILLDGGLVNGAVAYDQIIDTAAVDEADSLGIE